MLNPLVSLIYREHRLDKLNDDIRDFIRIEIQQSLWFTDFVNEVLSASEIRSLLNGDTKTLYKFCLAAENEYRQAHIEMMVDLYRKENKIVG
ncbi:hypothetical protein [Gottfriedia acidiceleris]|uniref:hypothetical protein n=1 Tax=Gottfriedia acidiceleris TaxID=371036 RepID=UPI002FFE7FF5